jgi:hypothetical protein
MSSIFAALKSNLSMYMLQCVLNALSTDQIRVYVEGVLDYITTKVLGSASKIDDNLVFPIIGAFKAMLSLPPDARIDTRTLSAISATLMSLFDAPQLKKFADWVIDLVEVAIENSETVLDDKFALPAIRAFRVAFDIPDDDPVVVAPVVAKKASKK